jgi:hypothetical protein
MMMFAQTSGDKLIDLQKLWRLVIEEMDIRRGSPTYKCFFGLLPAV